MNEIKAGKFYKSQYEHCVEGCKGLCGHKMKKTILYFHVANISVLLHEEDIPRDISTNKKVDPENVVDIEYEINVSLPDEMIGGEYYLYGEIEEITNEDEIEIAKEAIVIEQMRAREQGEQEEEAYESSVW